MHKTFLSILFQTLNKFHLHKYCCIVIKFEVFICVSQQFVLLEGIPLSCIICFYFNTSIFIILQNVLSLLIQTYLVESSKNSFFVWRILDSMNMLFSRRIQY